LTIEFTRRGPAKVLYTFDLDAELDEDAGHATITETAAVMALREDRIDLKRLPPVDQALNNTEFAIVDAPTFSGQPAPDRTVSARADPRRATPELGKKHFNETVERLSAMILKELKSLS
jgi:creatinine amidohydrolase/Fe(II)-dependent formamide hydrolase-like protein